LQRQLYEVDTQAVDGWAVTFGTAKTVLGRGRSSSRPILAEPNVTAHPSAASVPITVLLYCRYSTVLMCRAHKGLSGKVMFNVIWAQTHSTTTRCAAPMANMICGFPAISRFLWDLVNLTSTRNFSYC